MTLSTMDIPFSPEMGGKEGLSALGWSRTHRHEAYERWVHKDGTSIITFVLDGCPPHGWLTEAKYKDEDGLHPLTFTADEFRAAFKRMEELEAGDTQ